MTNPTPATVTLRGLQSGDLGWVLQQHGRVYASEYGWDLRFEALVAGILAKYIEELQPEWDNAWIAELNGEPVGSVFLVRQSVTQARLRMLILSPHVRGLGLGARLTDECIAFARTKGYKEIVLWTHSCLTAARHIYAQRGFRLTQSDPYHGFGHDLVGETWELTL